MHKSEGRVQIMVFSPLQLMEFCDDNSGDDNDYEIVQVAVEGACRILSNT